MSGQKDDARHGVGKVQSLFEIRQKSREGALIEICEEMAGTENR